MESPQRILKLPDWEGALFSQAAGEFRITDDGVFPPQKPKLPLSSSVLAKYFSIHAQEGAVVGSDGVEPPESNDSRFMELCSRIELEIYKFEILDYFYLVLCVI